MLANYLIGLREGRATPEELEAIGEAWRAWAVDPDGWFSVHHGEILCHKHDDRRR